MAVIADVGQARDVVMGMLKTAWDTIPSPAPVLLFQDQEADAPAPTHSYGEAVINHKKGNQVTLGEPGGRRFRAWATLTVTIRTEAGDGLTSNDAIVKIVQDAFEGKSKSGVDFRAVRPQEDGRDGAFYKTRVLVDFEYDRIK